ncbi:MAG: M48 family metallopeptidase [Cyclobacteriaceae bacterium]|nr:M48 family metallopeptidase [Cyclobacteriaceae bacterium]
MEAKGILILLLVILSFDFIFNKILEYLNIKSMKEELPDEVKGIYDEEKYKKSISYARANNKFGLLTSSFSFILSFVLLATGFFGWFDHQVHGFIITEELVSLAFFGLLFLASDILNIPFQLYDTFVIEEKFGFNKTTSKTFILDKLKGYVLAGVIGGLILFVLLKLINLFGPDFWIYFWIVISVFILFINMFYTSLILPLFNKLTPLEDGELKDEIETYSKKIKFPLDNIFVIDGSKRSAKSNAFFSGIGKKKKIVLYDTLIENHSKEELVAVLAHEVGHFKKKHIITGYVLSILQTGFTLFIMSLIIFSPAMSEALGGSQLAIHLNLLAFGILYSPISHFVGVFMNMLSRKNEFEADAFAKETYNGTFLQQALKKLSVDNLSNLFPHPAYVFMNYSHPPLLKRLAAMNEQQP